MRDGPFDNSFVLASEHKRVLQSAYERADERAQAAHRYGYWKGIAATAWATVFIGCVGFVAGFMVGMG